MPHRRHGLLAVADGFDSVPEFAEKELGDFLLVYILSGTSLRWTFLALGTCASAVLTLAMRMTLGRRGQLLRRNRIGTLSGLASTTVYDAVRLTLVGVGGLKLNPLETWRLFGIALIDAQQPAAVVMAAGAGFHVINGVAFGVESRDGHADLPLPAA